MHIFYIMNKYALLRDRNALFYQNYCLFSPNLCFVFAKPMLCSDQTIGFLGRNHRFG